MLRGVVRVVRAEAVRLIREVGESTSAADGGANPG